MNSGDQTRVDDTLWFSFRGFLALYQSHSLTENPILELFSEQLDCQNLPNGSIVMLILASLILANQTGLPFVELYLIVLFEPFQILVQIVGLNLVDFFELHVVLLEGFGVDGEGYFRG